MQRAELCLQLSAGPTAGTHSYVDTTRKISLYVMLDHGGRKQQRLFTKLIRGSSNGWEKVDITRALTAWRATGATNLQVIDVRVEPSRSARPWSKGLTINIDTTSSQGNEPLLVVFSDNEERRQLVSSELSEIKDRGMGFKRDDVTENTGTWRHRVRPPRRGRNTAALEDFGNLRQTAKIRNDVYKDGIGQSDFQGNRFRVQPERNNTALSYFSQENRTIMEVLYHNLTLTIQDGRGRGKSPVQGGGGGDRRRYRRGKSRRRPRRNPCRRKPMYVSFADINWHTWIIAPRGYQVNTLSCFLCSDFTRSHLLDFVLYYLLYILYLL